MSQSSQDSPGQAGPPEDAGRPDNVSHQMNGAGNQSNETRGQPEDVPGESAQFDARLMTAIQTLEALTEIAPSGEASGQIEEAFGILKGVQNSTDTASLGEDGTDGNETSNNMTDGDTTDNETGTDVSGEGSSQQSGPGQSGQGGGPPGFVRGLIGGIFGN